MPVATVDLRAIDSIINPVYAPYLDDHRRFQIFKGGAGGGKSVFISQRAIYSTILLPGYNGLVCRKTGRDNHNSTFAELCKAIKSMGFEDLFDINRSWGKEEIICKVNGNKIIFRGLDDLEKVKSVTFETGDLVWVWVEEATEAYEEDFNQLNLRVRGAGPINKHIILSFNPVDIDSWIKPRFFDRLLSPRDGFICETTYKDNLYLDPADIIELERYKDIDQYFYSVYALNQWGARTTATVFQNIVIEEFDYKESDFTNRRFGMDFGWTHANAMEGIGFRERELYVWWESYAKRMQNADWQRNVASTGLPKQYTIKADSAEPDKIAEWQNNGWENCFAVTKGAGSVKRQVDYLAALPKIHIHAKNCPNAAREFPRFRRRQLKDGTILDNEFVELEDDTVAAVRYAIDDLIADVQHSHFFIKRN